MATLEREFYLQNTTTVARQLLGKVLCLRTPAGVRRARIVETEAYLGLRDEACHSFHGKRTERVATMYLEGGHTYVYLIYGMYHCLNVVTGSVEHPEAVLIRAVEPLDVELPARARKSLLLTNGPGKLCRYYGVDRGWNGLRMYGRGPRVWIEDDGAAGKFRIERSKRIGVEGYATAKDKLLRFSVAGNRFVSR